MASDSYLFHTTPVSNPRAIHNGLILALVAFIGAFLAVVVAMGLLKELAVLTAGVMVAVFVWRFPVLSAIFLVAFTSVNRFVIFLGFYFHGSTLLLKGTQLWKDEIVLVLLARVAYDALTRGKSPRVQALDIVIACFLLLNLLYIAYPGTLEDNTLVGRVLGFRLDAYFLLAYFAGRGLTLKREHVKWMMLLIVPGSILVALVAAYQWVMPGSANALWDRFGYQAFVDAVGGSSDIAVRDRVIAGVAVPRSSSLLMGDLALAFYQLLLVPIAAGVLFAFRSRGTHFWAALFLMLMLGTLAMSGARSAMVAAVVVLAVMTFWSVSWGRSIAVGSSFLIAGVIGLVVVTGGINSEWFSGLANPDEGSTLAHQDAVAESVELIKDNPLGRGLGTSHTVGYQLGVRESFANESWYLQIGSETGVLGMVMYSLVILGATIAPLVAFHQVRDPWLRALTLGMGGAGLGFLLVGLVLHVWEAPVIAAAFWLLLGIAVRAPQLEEEWQEGEAAEEPA